MPPVGVRFGLNSMTPTLRVTHMQSRHSIESNLFETVGPLSRILKSVMVPIYDTKMCRSIHLNKSMEAIVDLNSEICAGGSAQGGTGVCVSDSGGPLQCQSSDNKWYQIGISSWTYRCAAPGVPDVYTKVSKFYDWIEKTIQNDSVTTK